MAKILVKIRKSLGYIKPYLSVGEVSYGPWETIGEFDYIEDAVQFIKKCKKEDTQKPRDMSPEWIRDWSKYGNNLCQITYKRKVINFFYVTGYESFKVQKKLIEKYAVPSHQKEK